MSIHNGVANSKNKSQKVAKDAIDGLIHYILRQDLLVNEMKWMDDMYKYIL